MPKHKQKSAPAPQQPGPGRSTSQAAFDEVRREVARRNEAAHDASVKRRAASERAKILARRAQDI